MRKDPKLTVLSYSIISDRRAVNIPNGKGDIFQQGSINSRAKLLNINNTIGNFYLDSWIKSIWSIAKLMVTASPRKNISGKIVTSDSVRGCLYSFPQATMSLMQIESSACQVKACRIRSVSTTTTPTTNARNLTTSFLNDNKRCPLISQWR